jgi:hypothetical protein
MRCLVIVKASEESEAGVLPDEQFVREMMRYNEELVKAGVLLTAEGLYPSSKGKRVRFAGGKTTVIDGPFTETKELIAGFWLWQVASMDEAIAWVKRCPKPADAAQREGVIEIRPLFEASDFCAQISPAAQAQEEHFRAELEKQKKA